MVCCCFSCSLEVINHLNIYFFTLSVDWTLRVVSTLLIGPQGEEKNYIFGAHTSMAPTSAVCTGTMVMGVIKLQCASELVFTARADKTLNNNNNLVKVNILQYVHFKFFLFFQTPTIKCLHALKFINLIIFLGSYCLFLQHLFSPCLKHYLLVPFSSA